MKGTRKWHPWPFFFFNYCHFFFKTNFSMASIRHFPDADTKFFFTDRCLKWTVPFLVFQGTSHFEMKKLRAFCIFPWSMLLIVVSCTVQREFLKVPCFRAVHLLAWLHGYRECVLRDLLAVTPARACDKTESDPAKYPLWLIPLFFNTNLDLYIYRSGLCYWFAFK